ncbi:MULTISPECIES: nicotinamide riboside transporter PnuC [unclassified Pseudomonas]|uniref:nicotinamide riboside transporter PnuC n=1 Tax=unclassified Pseudomonas TaxID=196821 RepID=UPI002446E6D7|nr:MULTISPECIES: nicotinamide riboside transporter PnuC [unclassified Pseudomonas]MDH0892822.1 nicotinamide riboside transporter PnuC [Pseudomonas sp. GD03875]MDH1063518.1 nicotinamide riboside transporter PnuC [Pseudomonas sp. GD03985]
MTPLELLASALGVTAVWLTVRQNSMCWPIGLLMVLLYAWFFFDARLYSLVLLHGVFAAMQLYGWWQWRQGVDESGRRPVSNASRGEALIGLGAAVLIGLLLGLVMDRFTEAVHPWPDAFLTAFSLLAQLWMALKRWQCWLLWIVVDVLYVGFFALQDYWLTAGLYGVFTALAVLGLREWRAAR